MPHALQSLCVVEEVVSATLNRQHVQIYTPQQYFSLLSVFGVVLRPPACPDADLGPKCVPPSALQFSELNNSFWARTE
jgi:hypothetical protein